MYFDRLDNLAERIVNYSLGLTKGERCQLLAGHSAIPLVKAIAKECIKIGAIPIFYFMDEDLTNTFLASLPQDNDELMLESITTFSQPMLQMMDGVESVVVIRSKEMDTPYEGVTGKALMSFQKEIGKVFHKFSNEKKWVVFDWPTDIQANKARLSYQEFYQYVLDISLVDYAKMYWAAQPAKAFLDSADQVQIFGPGTDLRFSKRGINTLIGAAKNSYPDGELYTAPVKDSVEGFVTFTVPSLYMGRTFESIHLEFKKGRIIKASCAKGDNKLLNDIFNTDEGASYIGEFALGINPYVTKPMNDIHYDEKIAGSFHLTPGNCYNDAFNGNRSSIHWDQVCMQDAEHGGGEIWVDGKLLRKDGMFVMEPFTLLNPQELME
jgi:aminopeptidase